MLVSYLGELDYCSSLSECCLQVPCHRQRRPLFLCKTHDHRLQLPTDAPVSYLVQHREPVGHLLSHVEALKSRRRAKFAIHDPGFLERWLRRHAAYYAGFLRKWVHAPAPDALVLDYADLRADPSAALRSVVKLFDQPIDEERLQAAVQANIGIRGFRYPKDQAFERRRIATPDDSGSAEPVPYEARDETPTELTDRFRELVDNELSGRSGKRRGGGLRARSARLRAAFFRLPDLARRPSRR